MNNSLSTVLNGFICFLKNYMQLKSCHFCFKSRPETLATYVTFEKNGSSAVLQTHKRGCM